MRNQALQTETLMLELSAQTTDRGTVIVFSDLLFASGLTQLNADGMRATQKLADILRNNPKRTVLIESFTDTTIATSARKMQLSEGRANAVRNNLMGMGVGEKRIAIRAYGEAHPVADNDSGANRQLNRRVEIVFSDANGRITPR